MVFSESHHRFMPADIANLQTKRFCERMQRTVPKSARRFSLCYHVPQH